jgi:hypothetical protein
VHFFFCSVWASDNGNDDFYMCFEVSFIAFVFQIGLGLNCGSDLSVNSLSPLSVNFLLHGF